MLASGRDALFYFRMKILRQLRPAFTCALGLSLGCVSQQRGASAESSRNSKEFLVYVGTYTGPKSKGIYVSRFASASGKLDAPELAAETISPSFLALHPNRRFLYAANEIRDFDGKKSGAVSAFVIASATGKFDPANGSLVANDPPSASVAPGSGPRHLAFHPRGRYAYVINEMKCTMTTFSYEPERGEMKLLQTLSTLPDGETAKPNYSTAEV